MENRPLINASWGRQRYQHDWPGSSHVTSRFEDGCRIRITIYGIHVQWINLRDPVLDTVFKSSIRQIKYRKYPATFDRLGSLILLESDMRRRYLRQLVDYRVSVQYQLEPLKPFLLKGPFYSQHCFNFNLLQTRINYSCGNPILQTCARRHPFRKFFIFRRIRRQSKYTWSMIHFLRENIGEIGPSLQWIEFNIGEISPW